MSMLRAAMAVLMLFSGAGWGAEKKKEPVTLEDLLRGSPRLDPDKDPRVLGLRREASEARAEAEKLFAEAGKKKDKALGLLGKAKDYRISLREAADERAELPPPSVISSVRGRRDSAFHIDPTKTVDTVVRGIARTHALMPKGDPKKEFDPSALELPTVGKMELPDVTPAETQGKATLVSRKDRSESFEKAMQTTYWGQGGGAPLKHDCQYFKQPSEKEFDNLAAGKLTTYSPLQRIEASLIKPAGDDNKPIWICNSFPDKRNGTVLAFASERQLIGAPSPRQGGLYNPNELTTLSSDAVLFTDLADKTQPLTHQASYLDAHADEMFAHRETMRLNFAHYQAKNHLTLSPGEVAANESDRLLEELERVWQIPIVTPMRAFSRLFAVTDALAEDFTVSKFVTHFTTADSFDFGKLGKEPVPQELATQHFFAEAKDSFKKAEQLSRLILKEATEKYTDSVKRYNEARSGAESALQQAEAKVKQAEAADRAADKAARDAAQQQANNDKGNPNSAGKKGGGSPNKGGGGEGNPGQRAQLTPPEAAKIPSQTEFPAFQFPQKPEEAGIDPRLVDLATRGATGNAQLGDLSGNGINGNRLFQGAQGAGPAQRGEFGFRPRNLLSRGVPPLQPGDAPGGAINNGGSGAEAAAAAAGAGGNGAPVGKGGGGDGGALGGNFENGIGYDPNGGEGARQRQTFSEYVAYGAGGDGGASTSNGDSGPPLSAQIASGPGGESIVLGPPGKKGARGATDKAGVATVGILSYVTNLSPIVGDRVKKIEFKEAFAKANAAETNRDPAGLRGVNPALASPSNIGNRVQDAIRRDGETTL